MADNRKMIRQHEPLRVPEGWTGQARALIIQLERIFDRIFSLLGGKTDKPQEFEIGANSNRTFTVGNSYKGVFILVGENNSNQAMFNVFSSSAGAVAYAKFGTSSAFTITTGTGTFKIANGVGYKLHVFVMSFNGSVT
jgi:hypothetical protein